MDADFDDQLISDKWEESQEESQEEYYTPYTSTSTAESLQDIHRAPTTRSSSLAVSTKKRPVKTQSQRRTDAEIELDLASANKRLDKLDALFVQAHQKKATTSVKTRIDKMMSEERNKIAKLEAELADEDEEIKLKADKLEQDIEQLNEELATITIQLQLKTDELHALRPPSAKDDVQNSTNLDQEDDDHARVWSRMEDRRQRYIDMYGVDPSVGSIANR
jgi:hypothetical protein